MKRALLGVLTVLASAGSSGDVEAEVFDAALLRVTMAFVAADSGIPALSADVLPSVALASAEEMHSQWRPGVPYDPEATFQVSALYLEPPTGGPGGTIWLSEDWNPYNDKDLSILVHEMVHVLQFAAGERETAPCLNHLERQAFETQKSFLLALGYSDPFKQMDTGPLAVILLTQCPDGDLAGMRGEAWPR